MSEEQVGVGDVGGGAGGQLVREEMTREEMVRTMWEAGGLEAVVAVITTALVSASKNKKNAQFAFIRAKIAFLATDLLWYEHLLAVYNTCLLSSDLSSVCLAL